MSTMIDDLHEIEYKYGDIKNWPEDDCKIPELIVFRKKYLQKAKSEQSGVYIPREHDDLLAKKIEICLEENLRIRGIQEITGLYESDVNWMFKHYPYLRKVEAVDTRPGNIRLYRLKKGRKTILIDEKEGIAKFLGLSKHSVANKAIDGNRVTFTGYKNSEYKLYKDKKLYNIRKEQALKRIHKLINLREGHFEGTEKDPDYFKKA